MINNKQKHFFMVDVDMRPWSTKAVLSRWGIFIAIAKNTLYGSKLYIFLMPKIIRILRSSSMKIFSQFLTVNISKLRTSFGQL